MNDALMQELNTVKFIILSAGRKPLFPWLWSILKEKSCRLLVKAGIKNTAILAQAVSRRNYLLCRAIKKTEQVGWVIGHNPGALYTTYKAAQHFKCRAGFDVEDYHPGEGQDVFLQGITRQLMQAILPKMNYVSFAAPLIKEAVKNDLGKEGTNWITVLNYFPAAEFKAPENIDGPLKLVWFSQNIAAGRGLENILPVLQKFPDEIELHLFGNLDNIFYEGHLKGCINVKVHDPLPQKELHNSLSRFDVGLALELVADTNRDLCITNKLLAYLQAGLFVMASDTAAQTKMKEQYWEQIICLNIKEESQLAQGFKSLILRKEELRKQKERRYKNFSNTNWEMESTQLINSWGNFH